jgi:hypothetical protein
LNIIKNYSPTLKSKLRWTGWRWLANIALLYREHFICRTIK